MLGLVYAELTQYELGLDLFNGGFGCLLTAYIFGIAEAIMVDEHIPPAQPRRFLAYFKAYLYTSCASPSGL